jgi:carboxypeptidase Q
MRRWVLIMVSLAGCQSIPGGDRLASDAERILKAALSENQAYERTQFLCDRIGHRLSGSANLEKAIDWACETMKKDGLANVRREKVMVPAWVRGEERAWLVHPARHELSILGLGGSVPTPAGGLEADVVVVKNFDELSDKVKGKIVLYNVAFTTYGETVPYRVNGASRASKFGAVASLVRSVTPVSLRTPHTGMMRYDEAQPKIPTAAVTIEDAELMQRLQDRGQTVRLRLEMNCKTLPDAESANAIGEVPGETDEIVVIGAHIDSWDVGTGAHDDGGPSVTCMEAARILIKLGIKPRRTIRVVLFTNEENGIRGGNAYRDGHRHEKHVVAIETDSGLGTPLGFGLSISDKAKEEKGLATLRQIARFLAPIGADKIKAGGGGADIGPLGKDGVPTMGLNPDMSLYWQIHHTHADTMDKVDKDILSKHVAAMAVMAYALANWPHRLGE